MFIAAAGLGMAVSASCGMANLYLAGIVPQESIDSAWLAFLTLPLFAWTALRFGKTGAALAGLGFSVVAAWSTASGHGPFVMPNTRAGLMLLWSYPVCVKAIRWPGWVAMSSLSCCKIGHVSVQGGRA